MDNSKIKIIAFYLPQFHPIPENDEWWGKGFTEWTNVGKAKPLFRGHYQPKVPADLGYYDLRLPEVREAQAELAKEAGIYGFCYWHYWFGNGKTILERPFKEVLETGKPDFPFCLGWANHSWTNKTWEVGTKKVKEQTLIEQTYPGLEDFQAHFKYILPAFKDKRYIRITGKPLFVIFNVEVIPNIELLTSSWNKLAQQNGLEGIFFVGCMSPLKQSQKSFRSWFTKDADKTLNITERMELLKSKGINAFETVNHLYAEHKNRKFLPLVFRHFARKLFRINIPVIHKMSDINKKLFIEADKREDVFPTLFPNWDRTPRSGKNTIIFKDSTPEVFGGQVEKALDIIKNKKDDNKILFLRSWNEWGEGNYMEPDLKYGKGYIKTLSEAITPPHQHYNTLIHNILSTLSNRVELRRA